MERQDLYYALFEQQKQFEEFGTDFVEREITKGLLDLLPLKMPIIITGVRRCGKSSLLKLIKDELKLKEKENLYIDFNDERMVGFAVEDFQKIIDFLNEKDYKEGTFLFIDEIQEVDNWEKRIDRIRHKHQIFISGSNSKLLSKEISTVLTGRSINLSLTPFNFREFLLSKNINLENLKIDLEKQSKIRNEFTNFLYEGGFPQRVISNQKILLSQLYENILYRDIIRKFSSNKVKPIKETSLYLFANISVPLSLRSLSRLINIKNISAVKEIFNAFEDAFLFFSISKFDYSIKKQIQNPRKIYCIDNGFISTLGFMTSENKGRFMENLTAIELKRRNKEMYYYAEKNECDFVIKEGIKIVQAIQSCYDLNENNKKREVNGLTEAMDKFGLKEGLILTYEQEDEFKVDGRKIKVIPVWKWLLSAN